ncbi:hypothetical protein ABZ686_00715 [Streptomyces sp. NPDC006992]|uniref:hypothetical protein n=1 Tax=Streptomyces sp. NPDC006992 TaxID=3155601 RepID=UPI0033FB9E09
MERLELLIVQLEEAKRMIVVDRVPQLRVAFILLDSAAEMILHRTSESLLTYQPMQAELLERWRSIEKSEGSTESLRREIESLEERVLSRKSLREIERNFDAKVSFLVSQNSLPIEIGPVLQKLHQYRNETYHRDKLRREFIRPAVLIYFDTVCSMLDHYDQFMVGYSSNTELGPEIRKYLGDSPTSIFRKDRYTVVAAQLRESAGLSVESMGPTLASHLMERLNTLKANLAVVEEFLENVPGISSSDILRIVQADLRSNPSLGDLRSRKYKYSSCDLTRWRSEAAALESMDEKYSMFTAYANIENEFEPLEEKVKSAVMDIDHHIQFQIDEARGK